MLPSHVCLQETRNGRDLHALEVFNNLVNLRCIMGMAVMLPLLRRLSVLIKILQENDLLILDALRAVRAAHEDIAAYYLRAGTAFQGTPFLLYNELGKGVNEADEVLEFAVKRRDESETR